MINQKALFWFQLIAWWVFMGSPVTVARCNRSKARPPRWVAELMGMTVEMTRSIPPQKWCFWSSQLGLNDSGDVFWKKHPPKKDTSWMIQWFFFFCFFGWSKWVFLLKQMIMTDQAGAYWQGRNLGCSSTAGAETTPEKKGSNLKRGRRGIPLPVLCFCLRNA